MVVTAFTPYHAWWRCPYGGAWPVLVTVIGPPHDGVVDTVAHYDGPGILVRIGVGELVGVDSEVDS